MMHWRQMHGIGAACGSAKIDTITTTYNPKHVTCPDCLRWMKFPPTIDYAPNEEIPQWLDRPHQIDGHEPLVSAAVEAGYDAAYARLFPSPDAEAPYQTEWHRGYFAGVAQAERDLEAKVHGADIDLTSARQHAYLDGLNASQRYVVVQYRPPRWPRWQRWLLTTITSPLIFLGGWTLAKLALDWWRMR